MDVSSTASQNIYSIRQAIGISNIKKAVGQDAQTLDSLIKSMEVTNAKIVENSVTPGKGSTIDVRV